ncbi:MAG: DUF4391 domain-containing protein [Bacteroidales bacterium]|nr:DUF4391 domain-containing protein [Bacteroidales bacterium]
MYGLPHTTEIRKQLPKKAIYAKFELKPAQRDGFDADVSRIDIVAVISPTTVPAFASGENIKEFYVLDVQLKKKDYDEKNIAMLSKLIPQNILFALQYEDETQLAIYHTKLIKSDWKSTTDTDIRLSGLNLDTVWENIIKDIGEIHVQEGKTLTEQIHEDEKLVKLKRQIEELERKCRTEKQPRRRLELYEKLTSLKKQL